MGKRGTGRDWKVVKPEMLADEVMGALREARAYTVGALKRAVDKTARQTAQAAQEDSPRRSGAYARGWATRALKASEKGFYGRVVHNRDRYRLTHLLQHGHGGPYPARAYPHIPSDAETEEILVKNLEREMQNG